MLKRTALYNIWPLWTLSPWKLLKRLSELLEKSLNFTQKYLPVWTLLKVEWNGSDSKSTIYTCIGPNRQTFERKIVSIFLAISLNICFECSNELSHWHGDSYFEYPQHIVWLRNKKINFWHTHFSSGLLNWHHQLYSMVKVFKLRTLVGHKKV